MAAGQLGLGLPADPARPRKAREPKKKRRGRPRTSGRVPHGRREVHRLHPLHVTLRVRREVWNLRSRRSYRVLARAFYGSLGREESRLAHFSIQGNHVHLLVEASDRAQLGEMMRVMCVRMAKGLNVMMGRRRGKVFTDRYHSRSLSTPTETRHALLYVLQNYKKHRLERGEPVSPLFIDTDYSSALWFTGWREAVGPPPSPTLVAPARTWLLDRGWHERGGGLLSRSETPRS